jgi:acyl-coenzyme A thioesterase PaaI-like protein
VRSAPNGCSSTGAIFWNASGVKRFRCLHGGVLATLVDSALTRALVTRLPKGMACTTIDLQMRFFPTSSLVIAPAQAIVGERRA